MRRKYLLSTFFLALNLCLSLASLSENKILYLEWFKESNGSLKQSFLQKLQQLFNCNIFIETGTYDGNTTKTATLVFNQIYSIELSETIYQAAYNRFRGNEKVQLYQGDSGTVLQKILPNISGNILFWLDAHYSGTGTAYGNSMSPILQELESIKNNDIKNSIILIDDLRGFYHDNWPFLIEVINLLHNINASYFIVMLGDAILAYPNSYAIRISPCLLACTISRLFDCNYYKYNENDVREAEEIIAKTEGNELTALQKFFPFWRTSDEQHGLLWEGLILEHQGKYDKCIDLFTQILNANVPRKINNFRINHYLTRVQAK